MDEPRKPTLTLKRIIVCIVAAMAATFVVSVCARYRSVRLAEGCLQSMRNLNAALVLYRADWDGFSPAYEINHQSKVDNALQAYAAGKPITCPSSGSLLSLRLSNGHQGTRDYLPFGVEDNSAVTDPCNSHIDFRTQVVSRNGWPDTRTSSSGVAHILLRSGTAKQIPVEADTKTWFVKDSVFTSLEPSNGLWSSYGHVYLFDFEPKPPQFEY